MILQKAIPSILLYYAMFLISSLIPDTGCSVETSEYCFDKAVGVSNPSVIPDYQMTASSRYSDYYLPSYGRLNGDRGDGWCAKEANRNDDWLQIYLGRTIQVCAVATQGDINGNEWATDFKISFSTYGIRWNPYKGANGAVVEFHRQGDSTTVDKHELPVPIPARYIRFHPTKQHAWNCLRVEVFGTEVPCRNLEFRAAQVFRGKRLLNHVIRVTNVTNEGLCRLLCYSDNNCISYNFKTGNEAGKQKCELNNATHEVHEEDLEENPDYVYRGATNTCLNSSCKNNATCQTGFTDRKYRCLCFPGFTGQDCENDIDECNAGTHRCSVHAVCSNTKGSYSCICKPGYQLDGWYCEDIDECNAGTHSCSVDAVCSNTNGSYSCICKPGYQGDGWHCEDVDECATGQYNCNALEKCNNTIGSYDCPSMTCKDIYDRNLSSINMAYQMKVGSETTSVYCHLSTAGLGVCGVGGWTLVMKINGTQSTFHYDSTFWTNKETFNPTGGETGLDTQQTKLPTYWSTSFSKICLGMKIPGDENVYFIAINKPADSLYSLISDGQFRATSLGRDTWKSLLGSQGSLQQHCNSEGFNAVSGSHSHSKARIGILGNNENHCGSCDSRIGFGTGGSPDGSNTCGNVASYVPDNGNKYIKAMGYIFVQ